MKRITLVMLSIIMATGAFAQLPFTLGPKIGFNSSKVVTDFHNANDLKEESKAGFLFGGFLRINAYGKLYLQPEVYWATKGGDFTTGTVTLSPQFPNVTYSQETKLQTIDVPVLIGAKIIDMKVFNLRLMAGPIVSFITSKDVEYKINGATIQSAPVPAGYKDVIWGIQAGAGIDIMNFTLDVRYEWGLNDISDAIDANYKSKLLNVSLGFKLF